MAMALFFSLLLLSFAIATDATSPLGNSTATADPQRSCNHDNCLRALLRAGNAQVKIFCNSPQATPIPTAESDFIAKCKGSQSRMSSACACVTHGSTTAAPIGSSTTTTSPFAFQTGLFAPPPTCPDPSPAVADILLQFPPSPSAPYNISLSAFDTTDPNLSFSLVGDPTFNTLPQVVTTLDDAYEKVVFNFSTRGDVYGMTATVANGSSFTIYSNGDFEFYPANCTAGWFDSIDLGDLSTNISSRENLASVKRDVTPFNVELVVKDTCGNPINNLSPHLSCQVEITAGLSVKTFFSTVQAEFTPNGAGSYSGTCNTVDTENTKLLCELGITSLCQLVQISRFFPGLCAAIGIRIGQTLGGVAGIAIGEFLGPGVVYSTLIGVFLGGRAGAWLCQAAMARLSTICVGLNAFRSNLCTQIANAENVAVQAVGLPGGTTVIFPSVGSATPGVTVTQLVGTAGAACPTPTPPSLPSSCTAVPAEYTVVNQYCKTLCARVCAVTVCPSSEAFLQQSLVGACYDNCACMTQGLSLDGVCVPGPPQPGPVFCYTDPGCPPSSGQYYSQGDITAYSKIFGVPPGTCPLGQTTLLTGN